MSEENQNTTKEDIEFIKKTCIETKETDMVALMKQIRENPIISIHGVAHHSMLPAIIIATYRNLGGNAGDDLILTGIERGRWVGPNFCGYTGACGASLGVGIGFGLLIGSNSYDAVKRQTLQKVTYEVIGNLNKYQAARCCQRDCWTALKTAVKLSQRLLPFELRADEPLMCVQMGRNKYCLGKECPLHPYQVKQRRKAVNS